MEKLKSILQSYGQQHLLYFADSVSEEKKNNLINQVKNIDFNLMQMLYEKTQTGINQDVYKVTALDKIYVKDELNSELLDSWKKLGIDAIKNNKFAIITMAGGQGTRLGHSGPKGTYMIDVAGKSKSIFEILIEKLKKAKGKYMVPIHWYIMTSEENNDDTIKFFKDNSYFNYGEENITFFKQGVLPMLDEEGKIILESKNKIKLASDGNGGIFKAIGKNVLEDMKTRRIEWVYISGVDNILVNFVDEIFLGGTIKSKVDIASKSVLKENAHEKVGLICKKNDKPCVIEYTEIPEEMIELRKSNGELLLCEANIVSNIFSVKLLEKLVDIPLPYHVAKKKCDILDEQGIKHESIEPNAYKFESFIFDSYSYVDDIFVMRVKREEEFAPIKNKEGVDSPETASKLYNKQYITDSAN